MLQFQHDDDCAVTADGVPLPVVEVGLKSGLDADFAKVMPAMRRNVSNSSRSSLTNEKVSLM